MSPIGPNYPDRKLVHEGAGRPALVPGVLTLNDGFQLSFDVSGAKLLETGIATVNFEGEVYNLTKLQDFEGTYYGASTKITVFKGKGELQTNNANCVFIRARSTSGGLQLSGPAPEGLAIKFEK